MFDKGRAFAFIASIDDPLQSTRICAAIDALFANSPDETLTQNEAEYAQSQLRQLGDVGADGERHRRCRAVHAAVPDRQHDAAGRARAHPGVRRPEGHWLLGWHGDRHWSSQNRCCCALVAALARPGSRGRDLPGHGGAWHQRRCVAASRRRERRSRRPGARAREWLAAGMACTPAYRSSMPWPVAEVRGICTS